MRFLPIAIVLVWLVDYVCPHNGENGWRMEIAGTAAEARAKFITEKPCCTVKGIVKGRR